VQQMLRYSRSKLCATAFICAASVCLLLILFVNRGVGSLGFSFWLFSNDIGRSVAAPLLILPTAFATLRASQMALGSLDAVIVDQRTIKITTFWRSHSIDWLELKHVALVARTFRSRTHYEMRFHSDNAKAVSLPLGIVALPERDYQIAYSRLVQAHQQALGQVRTAGEAKAAPGMLLSAGSTFGRKRV